jgi:hypothetical protein
MKKSRKMDLRDVPVPPPGTLEDNAFTPRLTGAAAS